jgi:hypothetical protein
MNQVRLSALAVFSLVFAACSTSSSTPTSVGEGAPAPAPAEEATEQPAAEPEEAVELFGAPLDAQIAATDFAEIVTTPEAFDGKEVLTNGTVRANCQKRGCWMEVRPDAQRDGATATIRFKDYAFFMPLDSRGARVKLQGIVQVRVLTKGQVAEMEAEGGSVGEKRPDGSAVSLEIMASGVEMRGRKTAGK